MILFISGGTAVATSDASQPEDHAQPLHFQPAVTTRGARVRQRVIVQQEFRNLV